QRIYADTFRFVRVIKGSIRLSSSRDSFTIRFFTIHKLAIRRDEDVFHVGCGRVIVERDGAAYGDLSWLGRLNLPLIRLCFLTGEKIISQTRIWTQTPGAIHSARRWLVKCNRLWNFARQAPCLDKE